MAYGQMQQPGRAAYPVQKCRVEQAPDVARELTAGGNYDLLFFDLPGTVNSSGILRTIAQMDYISPRWLPTKRCWKARLPF